MNIKEVLQNSYTSPIEKLESEILLAYVLQVTRGYLHTHTERALSQQEYDQFCVYQKARQQGKPIAYIIQEKEFWSLKLKVTPDTLIPRPETELLLETVLEIFLDDQKDQKYNFLELATGSGAISIALAKTYPKSHIAASDISEKALEIARENQHYHELINIDFIQSNWFELIKNPPQKFDAIISNPPYISEKDPHLLQGDLRFEPRIALTPGETGLEAIGHIISHARDYLSTSGWIFLEHGYDQGEKAANLLRQHGYYQVNTKKDLNNLPRVTFGTVSDVQ
jgi:release factor glutamine methyltransferase